MKLTLLVCATLSMMAMVSCKKNDGGSTSPPAKLSVNRTSLRLGNLPGYTDSFTVQSNAAWQLSVSPASASAWMQCSAMKGSAGTTVVKVSVITGYPTATQTATITATATGDTSGQPATIAINQKIYTMQWSTGMGGFMDDIPYAIAASPDGGAVAAGYTKSTTGDVVNLHGDGDVWVTKVDAAGNKIWLKTFGGGADDGAYAITPTSDGGYATAGWTSSDGNGDVGTNHGGYDMYVVKMDAAGNKLWTRTLGGVGNEIAYAILATGDGGYAVAGITTSNNSGDVGATNGLGDMLLIKLDANGNVQWSKTLGGSDNDFITSIVAAPDGGYTMAGLTYSNSNGDIGVNQGQTDWWIVKVDANGNKIWSRTYGGTGYDKASALTNTADGGYMVAGYAYPSTAGDVLGNHGDGDVWVMKIDGSGNKVWSKEFGGNGDDEATSILATADSTFLITGYARSTSNTGDVGINNGNADLWVLEMGGTGNLLWQKQLGGSLDEGSYYAAIVPAKGGGYVIAANAESSNGDLLNYTNRGQSDFWMLQLK